MEYIFPDIETTDMITPFPLIIQHDEAGKEICTHKIINRQYFTF